MFNGFLANLGPRLYRWRLFFIWASVLIFQTPALAASKCVNFVTHELPPLAMTRDGKVTGLFVELVQQAAHKQGRCATFDVRPFKRGLLEMQVSSERAFFPVARIAQREKTLRWVGPVLTNRVLFYKRSDDSRNWRTLDELKNIDIGVAAGNSDDQLLTELGFTKLQRVGLQQSGLVNMLAHKRFDVTPIGEIVMPHLARDVGLDPGAFSATGIELYESSLYLTFPLNTPDSVVKQWQRALDRVRIDHAQAFAKKYGVPASAILDVSIAASELP